MANVPGVAGKVGSTTTLDVRRVDSPRALARLLPFVQGNEKLVDYVSKRWNDPETLILHCGQGCTVITILEHDFFGRVALLAWAQNPDHWPLRPFIEVVEEWAKDQGATQMIAFLDQEISPWRKLKGLTRLTGMSLFRMLLAKEL